MHNPKTIACIITKKGLMDIPKLQL